MIFLKKLPVPVLERKEREWRERKKHIFIDIATLYESAS